jgi:alpha-L-rhamnosidase
MIKSAWKKLPGSVYLNLTIPAKSTATIYFPTKNKESISESNRPVVHLEDLQFLKVEGAYAIFEVAPGTYHFKSDW